MMNSGNAFYFSAEATKIAAEKLKAGHLVAFPTETVYGLGADATNQSAVKRIYQVKGRPIDHPLIVHVSSINGMSAWAKDIPTYATELARTFWPGPMTLILRRNRLAGDFITGGQESVAIRVPSHPVSMALLQNFETLGGLGVAAPSANRFGQVSPTSSFDVAEEIGKFLEAEDIILDGGRSDIGIESTIIDCMNSSPVVLRPGAVTKFMINQIIRIKESSENELVRSSGSFEKHYSPAARILINVVPKFGQAYLALSEFGTPVGVYRISEPDTVEQFAKDLYRVMRRVDSLGIAELVIKIPTGNGLSEAISDRVFKSAGGR